MGRCSSPRRANSSRSSSTSARSRGRWTPTPRSTPCGARARPGFLRHLARRALDQRPPIGFVRDLIVEPRASTPGTSTSSTAASLIVATSRGRGRSAPALTAKGTIDRLRRGRAAGPIDADAARGSTEAFRFLWEIRLRHHVEQVRRGQAPDDFVDPRSSARSPAAA